MLTDDVILMNRAHDSRLFATLIDCLFQVTPVQDQEVRNTIGNRRQSSKAAFLLSFKQVTPDQEALTSRNMPQSGLTSLHTPSRTPSNSILINYPPSTLSMDESFEKLSVLSLKKLKIPNTGIQRNSILILKQ